MSTEVANIKIEGTIEIINKAPEVLKKNQDLLQKALTAAELLFAKIKGQPMSDELDQEINDHLVKLKQAGELMNSRRKPVTQIMDEWKKMYTSIEALVDSKGDIYSKFQKIRNEYAELKIKESAEKQRRIQEQAAKEQALVSLKCDIDAAITAAFTAYINDKREKLSASFDKITLVNYERAWEYYNTEQVPPPWEFINARGDEVDYSTKLINGAEYNEAKRSVFTQEIYKEKGMACHVELNEYRQSILDKLPSKKKELEAIAEAEKNNAAEADRLKNIAAERQAAEQARIKQENEQRQKEQEAAAVMNKEAQVTNTLFDKSVAMAEVTTDAPKVREGCSIEVLKTAGWMNIFQFYFEREGSKQDPKELEKRTWLQMKTFCEKWNVKHGEIINSPFLKYTETFKAIATKN